MVGGSKPGQAVERVDIIRTDLDLALGHQNNDETSASIATCATFLGAIPQRISTDASFFERQNRCTSSQQSPELTLKASSAASNTYANGRRVIVWLTDTLSARINPEPLCTPHSIAPASAVAGAVSLSMSFYPGRALPKARPIGTALAWLWPYPRGDLRMGPRSQSKSQTHRKAVHLAQTQAQAQVFSLLKDRVIHYQTCAIVCACV